MSLVENPSFAATKNSKTKQNKKKTFIQNHLVYLSGILLAALVGPSLQQKIYNGNRSQRPIENP